MPTLVFKAREKNTIFYFNFISFFFFCNRKSPNFASSKHSESICHGMKSQVPEMHKMFNQAKTSKFHTKLHFCNCTWAGYLECFHPFYRFMLPLLCMGPKFFEVVLKLDYRTRANISFGLYIFYLIFHCSLYCTVVNITDNLCTKRRIL